jgi:transposase InsO family protein
LDLFARKLIAYSVGNQPNTELAALTLESAYKSRRSPSGVLFHSDRSTQYTSAAFRKLLDRLDFVQSFSAKGHPYDNAVAESFFKFLKLEELDRKSFKTIEDLQLTMFKYERFYNEKRPHSANLGLTPN